MEFHGMTAVIVLLLGGPSGREGQRAAGLSVDICLRDFLRLAVWRHKLLLQKLKWMLLKETASWKQRL